MVVRRRLPGQAGPTGGQAYSDVLGVLEQWGEATLGVRTSDHSLILIPIAEVFRAKRVPAPPAQQQR